jgi:hypothetical protein
MKRNVLPGVLLTSALILAGCGAARAAGGRFGSAPLTPESKLAIGTLNLEGTPQAVDPALAAKLIPLWQLLVQLDGSASTAPQEIQAVVDQIRATMSSAQVQAIDNMNISAADAIIGSRGQGQSNGAGSRTGGTASGGGGGFGNAGGSGSSFGNRRNGGGGGGQFFQFSGGGGPGGPGGGGFAGGGFAGSGSGGPSTAQNQAGAALTAEQAENAVSGFLANRVIRLLESKVSG